MSATAQIPAHLLSRYLADPLGMDETIRSACAVLADCYYTVSVWPVPGVLTVDRSRSRTVRAKKVSKSDQAPA